ncbi:stage II sporulation protein P [Christensenellaceae bacterium OttesenSCG-928-M15]|nr:stage II sporulation protein P [Christensenellaceae bacterium OttesenSCG-928-M15]
MDRIWTKHKKRKKRPARKKGGSQAISATGTRLAAAGTLLLSMLGLILMTSGSASRRMLQFAMPLTRELPVHETEHETPDSTPITIARVDIDAGVSEEMRIEVLSPKKPVISELSGEEPRILIYHTHTTEAYTMTSGYQYAQTSAWRTDDHSKSIVAVGELLTKTLREEYGCNVIHDTTDHEPPKLSTSYSRSVETMQKYKERYPSITMFIDVHRDAGKEPIYTTIDGKRVAKMMFVVGTGEGATGTGFKEMPDFESNYALAYAITEKLLEVDSKLMRNIRVKTGRYNQHVSSQCLLVEMGDNANTLEDALNAVPYLAKAIVDVMNENAAPANAARATPEPTEKPLLWAPKN